MGQSIKPTTKVSGFGNFGQFSRLILKEVANFSILHQKVSYIFQFLSDSQFLNFSALMVKFLINRFLKKRVIIVLRVLDNRVVLSDKPLSYH